MPDMRFAPPNPLRIADRATGLNSVSVRSYNERLLLSLLLQHGSIQRVEIGQRTGLSAQTVSVLVRSLEKEGLVAQGAAVRGRVGPPSIPIALNPEGAFSIGVSVGPEYSEVVLVNFVGTVTYHTVLPNQTKQGVSNHSEILNTINAAIAALPTDSHERLAGLGLALPEEKSLHTAPLLNSTNNFEALQEEIEEEIELPVFVQNDITAAASGESMFGAAKEHTDYLFFYLGAELHKRLILNHQIHNGNSGFSYDVGVRSLEKALQQGNKEASALWDRGANWPDYGSTYTQWEEQLARTMADSFQSLAQFVEVDRIVLSSFVPPAVCQSICISFEKICPGIKAVPGNLHPSPKAVGAACLCFNSRFMVE